MRRALLLALALGGCAVSSCVRHFEWPLDTGVPPRDVPPDVFVMVKEKPWHELRHETSHGLATSQWVGKICVVSMPPRADVTPADWAHMEAHERRHCARQSHTLIRVPGGRDVYVWRNEP